MVREGIEEVRPFVKSQLRKYSNTLSKAPEQPIWFMHLDKRISPTIKLKMRIRFMLRISLLLGILFFSWIFSQPFNGLADDEVVPKNSPLYDELMPVAIKWKNAVLNRNVKVLLDYASPEDRKYIAPKLKDKKSALYNGLFGKKNSFCEILRRARRLKIVLIKHEGLEEAGQGVSIYYHDDMIKLKFPLGIDEAQRLYDRGEIVSVFFYKDEGKWFTSYEFFN